MVVASSLAAETRQRSFGLTSQPLDSFIDPNAEIDGKPVSDIQRELF
jgi:hypothetical protein